MLPSRVAVKKQNRLSYWSYEAVRIAAVRPDGQVYYYMFSISTRFFDKAFRDQLRMDSKALWDTVSTSHEVKENIHRKESKRDCNIFEAEKADVVYWTRGVNNTSDTHTERNNIYFVKNSEENICQ